MMVWVGVCGLLLMMAGEQAYGQAPNSDVEKSVVHILTFSQSPSWSQPWRNGSINRASGSGFVIEGKRIMTNAHVVSWARQIHILRHGDPRPYQARVVFVGHDCDLAVIEPEDESFFDGLKPLSFGKLPEVRSTVFTYGYPAGGTQISYTRGVVSRIEVQNYVHKGNRAFLAVQTDAAINPGNSGGPVIQDGRVVGVAFQGHMGLENAGYFIPPSVIGHFLKDIADGEYHGFPDVGIRLTAMENPTYRKYLGLPDNGVGARIDGIFDVPSTQELLRFDDVLLEANGYPVGSDGTVDYLGHRVHVGTVFDMAQHGEKVSIKVWRGGREMSIELPVYVYTNDLPEGNQYDVEPRYYVYGGLVFVPLCRDVLKEFGGSLLTGDGRQMLYELGYRRQEDFEETREEPIILARSFTHPANADRSSGLPALVDQINGVRIEKLEDVVKAFENPVGGYHTIKLMNRMVETFPSEPLDKAHPEILKTYGIAEDRHL